MKNKLVYIFWYFVLISILILIGYAVYLINLQGYSIFFISFISLYIVNFVFTLIVFVQKRQQAAKISWIIFIILIPIVGHLGFLIFGQRYKHRKSLDMYQQKPTFTYEDLSSKSKSTIMIKNQNIIKRGVYKAKIDFFNDLNEGWKSLFSDIEKAKKYIFINYYIIRTGEIYDHFKSLLIKKAREGVEIKMIVDDFGRWAMPWYELKNLKKQGIDVQIFNRVSYPFVNSSDGYRTHRKMTIIDGDVVHTGGINIADEYVNINKTYGRWIDFTSRIIGEATKSYILLFIDDWKITTGFEINPEKYLPSSNQKIICDSESLLIESSPEIDEPILQDVIVNLISNAKKSISIATPYLILTPEIFGALRHAILSGVEVKIFIPGKPDKKAVLLASHYYAYQLMEFGAKIYETTNMFLHSKIALFDEQYAYFGTANLDARSIFAQFEFINLVQGKVIENISQSFSYYESISSKLTKDALRPSKYNKRFIRLFVNIFSPIM